MWKMPLRVFNIIGKKTVHFPVRERKLRLKHKIPFMEGSGVLRMRRQHRYVNQTETRDTEERNEFKKSSKKKSRSLK